MKSPIFHLLSFADTAMLPIPDTPGSCPDQDHRQWVPHGDYCYYFSSQKVTWGLARDRCLEFNAILTPIHHPATNALIFQEANARLRNSEIWIGYYLSKSGKLYGLGWEQSQSKFRLTRMWYLLCFMCILCQSDPLRGSNGALLEVVEHGVIGDHLHFVVIAYFICIFGSTKKFFYSRIVNKIASSRITSSPLPLVLNCTVL